MLMGIDDGKSQLRGQLGPRTPQNGAGAPDEKFVPTCSICGEKHWPHHPLVPCVNKGKAKARAKAEKKARAEAAAAAKAQAKADAKARAQAEAETATKVKTERKAFLESRFESLYFFSGYIDAFKRKRR